MSLAVSWLLLPLVLGLLSLGCALLLEQASGMQLPRPLLLPLGFAAIVVACLFTTSNSATAQLTVPLVIALAVAGFVLMQPARPSRAAVWPAGAAVAAYAAYGAPVVLSGSATFAGYITLDDTSTWLGFADRLLEHGRNLTGLAPSSYEAALNYYWNENGYPAGAFPPLGVAHSLLGTDSAWLFQPYVAFLAALLALTVYGLSGSVIPWPRIRALAAFVAAQPALLYAYSLWGGVKEVASAALVVLVAALTPLAVTRGVPTRSLLPVATATAALIGVLNFGGAVWIVPIFVPVLVAGLRLHRVAFVRVAAAFAVFTVALSVPTLLLLGGFFNDASQTLTKETELGNLIGPLDKLQLFGIWPVGDFRLRPAHMVVTYALVALVAAAAGAGVVATWRRRAWSVALLLAGALAGCAVAVAFGSPWIDGKALAIASPAVLLAAAAGIAWLAASGRRVEAAVSTALVAGGVLWSNALAYHDVWLAPRSQLSELEQIGDRFAGQGPAMLNEFSPYGVRHFLRHLDPESPSELRRRPMLLRNGSQVEKGSYADVDEFQLDGLWVYRTLVLQHSPSASRPPSPYGLVWSGRYYDVWQRPEPFSSGILEHFPLGTEPQPSAVPPCGEVLRLADLAAARGGRLAAAPREPLTVVELSSASYPASWQAFSGSPAVVYPSHSGTLQAAVDLPVAGRYGFWVEGSFRRRLELEVDGHRVASTRHRLANPGVATPLGSAELEAGVHALTLRYTPASLSPGSGGRPFALGPLLIARADAPRSVTYVEPAAARSLCGRSLDWVEALSG